MAQPGGLLRLPQNCSPWGCRIRSLILCSSHGLTKGFMRLKKQLFRQSFDSAKNFSYSLIWGGVVWCGGSQGLNLWASLSYVNHNVSMLAEVPVFPIRKRNDKDPLQVGAMCRCSWAEELLKWKILQLCCHSNWVTQPDRLSLGCACWICAYTSDLREYLLCWLITRR